MTNKSSVTEKDIKHIAELAKLKLTQEDLNNFQKQLSDIIAFVDQLSTMDTKKIVPTSQVTGLENIFREDVVKPSLSQNEVLANTKRKYKGYFLVDAIFE